MFKYDLNNNIIYLFMNNNGLSPYMIIIKYYMINLEKTTYKKIQNYRNIRIVFF